MDSFFTSQFNYCLLIWMFHSRGLDNKINRLHEGCLVIAYRDNRLFFEELSGKNKSVSIHVKNTHCTHSRFKKVAENLSAPIVREIFEKRNNVYDLRNPSEFVLPKVHSVFHSI